MNSQNPEIINENEIIKLKDLLRKRWPGARHDEIMELIKSGHLKPYWLKKAVGGKAHIIPYELKYHPKESIEQDDWIYTDGRNVKAVFILKEVEENGSNHPDFSEKREDLDENGEYISSDTEEEIKEYYREKLAKKDERIRELEEKISSLKASQAEEISRRIAAHEADALCSSGIYESSYWKFISLALRIWNIGLDDIDAATNTIMKKFEKFPKSPNRDPVRKIVSKIADFRKDTGKDF